LKRPSGISSTESYFFFFEFLHRLKVGIIHDLEEVVVILDPQVKGGDDFDGKRGPLERRDLANIETPGGEELVKLLMDAGITVWHQTYLPRNTCHLAHDIFVRVSELKKLLNL
jgi:hypothetical protein